MTQKTQIDTAHAAMEAAPEDAGTRMGFYRRVADAELFALLTEEAGDATIRPQIFDVSDGRFALAFDSEDRLAEFAGEAVPYAALPGRVLAGLLVGEGIGLGLNLDVAPSAILLPPDALRWLVEAVAEAPDRIEATLVSVDAPDGFPPDLARDLSETLGRCAGLAACARLARASYRDGSEGHLLALVDTRPGAEESLARAVGEALRLSGHDRVRLDVTFVASESPLDTRLAGVSGTLDMTPPEPARPTEPKAPGSDPSKPPILR